MQTELVPYLGKTGAGRDFSFIKLRRQPQGLSQIIGRSLLEENGPKAANDFASHLRHCCSRFFGHRNRQRLLKIDQTITILIMAFKPRRRKRAFLARKIAIAVAVHRLKPGRAFLRSGEQKPPGWTQGHRDPKLARKPIEQENTFFHGAALRQSAGGKAQLAKR